MKFTKIINIIKKNLIRKLIFFDNNLYDVLILDNGYSKINLDNICRYKTITNELYFFCFIKTCLISLINLDFNSYKFNNIYLNELIKKFKTKILIGNDFNSKLYGFKNNKSIKTIVYQHSDHEISNNKILKKLLINKNHIGEVFCDYYLLKHKLYKQTLKFINSNFIEVGSVKNNEKKTIKQNNDTYDIMLISQFRKNPYKLFNHFSPKMMYNSDSAMWYVSRTIAKYSKLNNKKFCIATTFSREDKKQYNYKEAELEFFTAACGDFYTETLDSYNLSKKSKLIITTYSSLGLELLARGQKVLFLDPFYFLGGNYIHLFSNSNVGPHWYGGNDEKVIFEKINYLSNLNDSEWKKIIDVSPFKIKHDKNNEILKNIIQENLK